VVSPVRVRVSPFENRLLAAVFASLDRGSERSARSRSAAQVPNRLPWLRFRHAAYRSGTCSSRVSPSRSPSSPLGTAAALALFFDEPTPALTLIGALVLATIAAETAETRQLRQIAAEAERQARSLEAERERHLATLAHDRELADLAHLRALLDQAAVALHRGDEAIGGVKIAYTQFGRSMPERDPDARRELNARRPGARCARRPLARAARPLRGGGAGVREATDAALAVSRAVGWLEDDRPEDTRAKHLTIDTSRETCTAAARRSGRCADHRRSRGRYTLLRGRPRAGRRRGPARSPRP
jgi:hypothetical protein